MKLTRKYPHILFISVLYILLIIVTYFIALKRGIFSGILSLARVNPALSYSGLAISDKFQVLKLFSRSTSYLDMGLIEKRFGYKDRLRVALQTSKRIGFPLIAKPRVGASSIGIFKINNSLELNRLVEIVDVDYILQQYSDYNDEYAIHFCRDLETKQIKLLALTKREIDLENVLKNSAKKFVRNTNLSHMITPKLIKSVNLILKNKSGINYGRLDVKSKNLSSLLNGRFKIIELNGPMSEPIHIYDLKYSISDLISEFYSYYDLGFYYASKNKHIKINYHEILFKFIKCLANLPKISSYRL